MMKLLARIWATLLLFSFVLSLLGIAPYVRGSLPQWAMIAVLSPLLITVVAILVAILVAFLVAIWKDPPPSSDA